MFLMLFQYLIPSIPGNETLFDSISYLSGRGILRPMTVNDIDFGEHHTNTKAVPVKPLTKYIVFNNNDSSDIKIVDYEINYTRDFFIDESKVIGLIIPRKDSVKVQVSFLPQTRGYCNTNIKFFTDRKWHVSSYLEGIGLSPYITLSSTFNRDTIIINDYLNTKEGYINIYNNKSIYADTLFIIDIIEDAVLTSLDYWDDTTAFRYDKKELDFPIYIPPGESGFINIEALARKEGVTRGTLTLISNSAYEYQNKKSLSIWGILDTSTINIDFKYSRLFPNPANDVLLIENLPKNSTEIQIFDETGKRVMNIDLKSQTQFLKISIRDLSQGCYILRIAGRNEVVDRKLVIVK